MSDSELLQGPLTRKHLDAAAHPLSAATKKKPAKKKGPAHTGNSRITCTPGKGKPAKKKK